MAVLATAGHVDHGKSTLVRALTGIEPDRYAEERRRGMTLDLGFAWTTLPSGREVAFVDVPGHERFVPTMLAGVGPAPAVVFVVAADGGWMPQSSEHLDALSAFGVRHGVLVVTRSDLADPGPALTAAREALSHTTLAGIPAVSVSAATGSGMDVLRSALDELVAALPNPLLDAPVRFWIDRSFTIRGAGTVVTGTLGAGRIETGDELELAPGGRRVSVRSLQTAGRDTAHAEPVSRVAVNLRGVAADEVGRGDALITPGAWFRSSELDVRVEESVRLPTHAVLHVGSATLPVRVRPLGGDTVRLQATTSLPWHVGDRALLRDPGAHAVLTAVDVLDPDPPALRRRGAARERSAELALHTGPDLDDELRRRSLISRGRLEALGIDADPSREVAAGWYLSHERASGLRATLEEIVRAADDIAGGVSTEELRDRLDLPDIRLVRALVSPPLVVDGPRVRLAGAGLPPDVERRLTAVLAPLRSQPWTAPEADALVSAGLGPRELAAAVRAGEVERIADGVYLARGAVASAPDVLRELEQPFSAAQAKTAWGTTRRVAVPLLELLAARGVTARTDDGRHRLR